MQIIRNNMLLKNYFVHKPHILELNLEKEDYRFQT